MGGHPFRSFLWVGVAYGLATGALLALSGCPRSQEPAAPVSNGEAVAEPAAVPTPSTDEDDAVQALDVLAELIPTLTIPEKELPHLLVYQQKTGVAPTEVVKGVWQHGDYPNISQAVGQVQGMALTDEVVPFDELSRKERLMLWMDWQGDPGRELTCWQTIIARMNIADVPFLDGVDALNELWHVNDRKQLAEFWLGTERDREKYARMLEHNWLPRFASPISGRFFEPWHETFSAGNGYLRQVTNEEELAGIGDAVRSHLLAQASGRAEARGSEEESRYNRLSRQLIDVEVEFILDHYKFFYFRIYGEEPNRVIAEGLWRVTDYQKLMQMREEATAIPPKGS